MWNSQLTVCIFVADSSFIIKRYGLKSGFPVDIVEDGGCEVRPVVDGLYFLRSPDSIATFVRDGETYLLTANEGDDVEYGEYEEKVKVGKFFNGDTIGFAGMTASDDIFDPTDITKGTSRFFNDDCDHEANSDATPWCASDLRVAVGTAMIDYTDPTAPNIYRITALGGRGITLYKVTESNGLEMVWDSADEFEREGCAAYPWAHNSIQDEEFAAVGGPLYNSLPDGDSLKETIEEMNDPDEDGCMDGGDGEPGACPMGQTVDERAQKDGYAVETVVVGEACGKTYAVTSGEKNSIGYLYDLSDLSAPVLVNIFHLSPVSETLNPGIAYAGRVLGEIDSESVQFIPEEHSFTGKAGFLFSGAWSGTTSFWEFTCNSDNDNIQPSPRGRNWLRNHDNGNSDGP